MKNNFQESSMRETQKLSPIGNVSVNSPNSEQSVRNRLTAIQKNTIRVIAQYLMKNGLQ